MSQDKGSVLSSTGTDRPDADAPSGDRQGLSRTVTRLVSNLPDMARDLEPVQAELRQGVVAALRRRSVEPTALTWPRLDIALPAIEAMRYSSLQQEFANLIASSMDQRVSNAVLPAYVEILKQLSPDEIDLMNAAPDYGRCLPMIDISYVYPTGQSLPAFRNVVPASVARKCAIKANIPQYVDNLVRLNLMTRPLDQEADEASYRTLGRLGFVRDLMAKAPPKSKGHIERTVLTLTDLGDIFRRLCLR
jgi:hypothetical protein